MKNKYTIKTTINFKIKIMKHYTQTELKRIANDLFKKPKAIPTSKIRAAAKILIAKITKN